MMLFIAQQKLIQAENALIAQVRLVQSLEDSKQNYQAWTEFYNELDKLIEAAKLVGKVGMA